MRKISPFTLVWLYLFSVSRHQTTSFTPTRITTISRRTIINEGQSCLQREARQAINHRPAWGKGIPIHHLHARQESDHDDDDGESSSRLNNEEIARYSRHLVLGDVGMAGQEALKGASVLVIGAGGLGSPCLLYLAAAGVGQLGIVDADTVDESNLQRQIIHSVQTVDKSKCASAAIAIENINPHVKVTLYEEEFTSETAMRILQDQPWDVVVDGSDNFPTKYLINDACHLQGLPWVYSAILAFEGQLSFFNLHGEGPDYRDMLPEPPSPGDVPSCAEGGVLGVLPGTMGCLQATEVIKYILGRHEGLVSGRILRFDAMGMKFSEIGLERDPNRTPITELIDYQGFCAGPKGPSSSSSSDSSSSETATTSSTTSHPVAPMANGHSSPPPADNRRTMDEAETEANGIEEHSPLYHTVSPKECLSKLSSGWSPWVLDVRLQTEHDIVALPFTDRVVPHRQVKAEDIPKNGDVLVYCKAGVRGKKAILQLTNDCGVEPSRLYNLEGGIMKWQNDVDPRMPRY